MRSTFALLILLVVTLGPLEAHGNVFGAIPSDSANKRISACNALLLEAFSVKAVLKEAETFEKALTAKTAENAEGVGSAEIGRVRAWAHELRGQTAYETLTDPKEVQDAPAIIDGLAKLAEQELARLSNQYGRQRCAEIYAGAEPIRLWPYVESHSRNSVPGLDGGIEPSVHFLIGAGASSNEGETAFAPALGLSYGSNTVTFMALIDPTALATDGRIRLSESNPERDLGRQVLSPQLADQSLYLTIGGYFWRKEYFSWGFFGRLVTRRAAFDFSNVEEPTVDSEGMDVPDRAAEDDTTEAIGYLIAPTAGLALITNSFRFQDTPFYVGMQFGPTMRMLIWEDADPPLATSELFHGDVVDAYGVDLTFFLAFKNITPFVRMTLLGAVDGKPDSLVGFHAVFGMDVLASFEFQAN